MIGILAGGVSEVTSLLDSVTILNKVNKGNISYYEVSLNGNKFYIVLVGYGKVNVAKGLMYALVNLCVDKVIVVGNMASLNSTSSVIGSIGISSSSLEWDVDYEALGFNENVVPNNVVSEYQVSSTLYKAALDASNELGYTTNSGLVASGDTFVYTTTEAQEIAANTNALFLDVETGVVGQVSYEHNIPYISVKGISNYANDAAVVDYNTNKESMNNLANKVVLNMLNILFNEENETLCNKTNVVNSIYACPCNLRNVWNFFW